MSGDQFSFETHRDEPSWSYALEIVKSTLDIPTALPPLIKNCWSGLYKTPDFMHAIGFPGWAPRSLMQAANLLIEDGNGSVEDVERAVEALGVRLAGVVVAVNFVCRAALMKRPTTELWAPLFRETMTAIEVGYHFGSIAPEIGVEGGILLGFSNNAGLTVLLANDPLIFGEWLAGRHAHDAHQRAIKTFGCEPYQVGALALQQLGFGPEIALAAALANGSLHHELIEVSPMVSTWKAGVNWVQALTRGIPFPTDTESRLAFKHLLPPQLDGSLAQELQGFHAQLAEIRGNSSAWTWHLPRATYEETESYLAAPRKTTVKGKIWKTEKRRITIEPR